MKLVDWPDWLDNHIPYFEAEKLRSRFSNNPPECVLVIFPYDQIRNRGDSRNLIWEQVYDKITVVSQMQSIPIFLTSDTNQLWLWVFWDKPLALFTMMQL